MMTEEVGTKKNCLVRWRREAGKCGATNEEQKVDNADEEELAGRLLKQKSRRVKPEAGAVECAGLTALNGKA